MILRMAWPSVQFWQDKLRHPQKRERKRRLGQAQQVSGETSEPIDEEGKEEEILWCPPLHEDKQNVL